MNISISPCCNAFTLVNDLKVFCTQCLKKIGEIKDGDDVVVGVVYNQSAEAVSTARNVPFASQLATDPTCMLLETHKCWKCGAPHRLIRDASNNPVYICSNRDCREVTYHDI